MQTEKIPTTQEKTIQTPAPFSMAMVAAKSGSKDEKLQKCIASFENSLSTVGNKESDFYDLE